MAPLDGLRRVGGLRTAQVRWHNELLHRQQLRTAAEVDRLSGLVRQLASKLRSRTAEVEALKAKLSVYEDDVQHAVNTAMVALRAHVTRELTVEFEMAYRVSYAHCAGLPLPRPCRQSLCCCVSCGPLRLWAAEQEKHGALLLERDELQTRCNDLRREAQEQRERMERPATGCSTRRLGDKVGAMLCRQQLLSRLLRPAWARDSVPPVSPGSRLPSCALRCIACWAAAGNGPGQRWLRPCGRTRRRGGRYEGGAKWRRAAAAQTARRSSPSSPHPPSGATPHGAHCCLLGLGRGGA